MTKGMTKGIAKGIAKGQGIAIVGGGIAGLYYAWQVLRRSPGSRVHIYEAARRCGGRIRQIRFGGMLVAGGAGIGRKKKDRRLLALAKTLGVKTTEFRHKVMYGPMGNRLGRPIAATAQAITSSRPAQGITFRQHLVRVLGRSEAKRFVEAMGFGDDLDADARYTLETYGIMDNYKLGVGVRIPWNELVAKMVRALARKGCRIHTGSPVTRIRLTSPGSAQGPPQVELVANQRPAVYDKVVLALPISATRRLLAQVAPRAARMASRIRPQSFALLYGRSKVPVQEWLKGYTVVGGPLQKMISYGGHVAMIGYADNRNADRIAKWSSQKIVREVRRRIGAPGLQFKGRIVRQYIREGTHYYRPAASLSVLAFRRNFKKACPPMVRVVGEAVSLDQGWVEGALQSVDEDLSLPQ